MLKARSVEAASIFWVNDEQRPIVAKTAVSGILDTKVVGELWNKFTCPSGYSRRKNASGKSTTCRKSVAKYKYGKPIF